MKEKEKEKFNTRDQFKVGLFIAYLCNIKDVIACQLTFAKSTNHQMADNVVM